MRLHQIITGSRNKGRNSIAFLNSSGLLYIVYGRGRNLVVLDRDLFQVHLIPDAVGADSEEIACICCENLTGLVAVSDGNKIVVFETAKASKVTWREFGELSPGGIVTALGWFPHSSVCGKPLLLVASSSPSGSLGAHHYITSWEIEWPYVGEENGSSDMWKRLWAVESNGRIERLEVSPDGRFIATQGGESTVAREEEALLSNPSQMQIWCQTPVLNQPSGDPLGGPSSANWVASNLGHPMEVVAFSWRSMPRYLPPGWLPNALLTMCADGVARVWFESSVGSHRVGDFLQPKGASYSSHRNSSRTDLLPSILLNHPILCYYFRLWLTLSANAGDMDVTPGSDLAFQLYEPTKGGKFFLAGSINVTDSNLSVLSSDCDTVSQKGPFLLQWMNNKTIDVERKFNRLLQRLILLIASTPIGDSIAENGLDNFRPQIGLLDQMLLKCLSKWRRTHDTLLMLRPSDGSLFIWTIDGLDCSTLNGSMLCSFAHRTCNGSVYVGGSTNRARDVIHVDPTQHRRICQTSFSLRSRLPGTDFSRVTLPAARNSMLFAFAYENGSVTKMRPHMLLIDCFMARSKLAMAMSSEVTSDLRNRYLQDIRDIQLACTTSLGPSGPLTLDLYSTATANGGTLKHRKVECSAFMQPSGSFDLISTTSETSSQADGHDETVLSMVYHPMLPLVLTLSASEFIVWHFPLCSPGPLSAPLSPPLRHFGRYRHCGAALRYATFFPCIIAPTDAPNSAAGGTLPLSVIAVDSLTEIQLFSVDTTGAVVRIGSLTSTTDASLSSTSSLLLVIPAPSLSTSASAFLVIRVYATAESGIESSCRIETWRVDLNPERIINGRAIDAEASLARCKSSSLSPSSIITASAKISDQTLVLEPGVIVTSIKQGPSPVSWCDEVLRSSYVIATTCSHGGIRLWTTEVMKGNCESSPSTNVSLKWVEWRLPFSEFAHSRIFIPSNLLVQLQNPGEIHKSGRNRVCLSSLRRVPVDSQSYARVFAVACATNWRIAVGCAVQRTDPFAIVILECESSGGSEWMLEDVVVPSVDLCPCHMTSSESIQLDWVKTEDGGSRLLSFLCNQTLFIFSAQCFDVIAATRTPHLHTSSTLLTSLGEVGLRWTCLRQVDLIDTSKSPISPLLWLPTGLLMFHHSSHIYLFSQWPSNDSLLEANQTLSESRQQTQSGEPADPSLLNPSDAVETAFGSMGATRLKSTYSSLHLTTVRSRSALQPLQSGEKRKQFNDTFFNGLGLFEAAQLSNPILPQFHPRQLLEWMNLGRFRLVQALLVHLTRCLSAVDVVCGFDPSSPKTTVDSSGRHQRTRSISLVISGGLIDASLETSPPSTPSSSPELEIPPLPLYILLALDSLSFQHLATNSSSNATFDNFGPLNDTSSNLLNEDLALELNDEETKVQLVGNSDTAQRDSWRVSLEALGYLSNGLSANPLWDPNDHEALVSLLKFGNQEARMLSDLLSRYRLPGLSRLDQMYLLGIAELMANTRTEVTDRLSGIAAVVPQAPSNFTEHDQSNFPVASELELDDCGLRFVMLTQLYSYLCGTIPLVKRSQMMKEGLTSRSFVWAFHSEADEVLLSFLPSQKQQHHHSDPTSGTSGGLTWTEFRRYGCGWWIHSDVVLMQCAEKMARAEFLRTKDPMDSAIFYLAMHKPTVLASLFKSLGNRPLENFFRSDFTLGSPACKQAKLNAFRLLSQHKYVQAAALFLVGGWLEDAIKVCVDSVKDLQLAVVVCRLYSLSRPEFNESGVSPYHKLLRSHVIVHEDPYLRSIAYWVLIEPLNALTTLVQKPSGQVMDTSTIFSNGFDLEVCPSVFKLYTYIRSHPLVARHLRLTDEGDRMQSQLGLLDRRLYFRTAYHYNTIGCPALTLEVLSRLPHMVPPDVSTNMPKVDSSVPEPQNLDKEVQLSFFEPNEDARGLVDEGDFKVVWSDEEEEAKHSDLDEVTDPLSRPSSVSKSSALQHGDAPFDSGNAASNEPSIHLQMEYWACLRIFTEELCGMFSTASAEGGRLKKLFCTWIENEITILQKIGSPHRESCPGGAPHSPLAPSYRCGREQSLLIPIDYHGSRRMDGFVVSSIVEKGELMASSLPAQTDHQKKCEDRLHFYLLSNLEFVQSLIAFCSLHGESGVDLRVVRMELTYLLMDVFNNVSKRSDFSSQSRLLTSLPLLKSVHLAAFPGFMSLMARPLDLIKTLINDVNASLVDLAPPYLRFVRILPTSSIKELQSVIVEDGTSVVRRVGLLRNLCMTLSAYVFQCLSTGTWRECRQGNAGLAIAVNQSTSQSFGRLIEWQKPLFPNSEPSDWPGLLGLMPAECTRSAGSQHALLGVLAEAMVAVYMGLCVCALYTRDSCALYRLACSARLADSLTWSRVFGGVFRLKPLRPPAPPTRPPSTLSSPKPQSEKRGSFTSSLQTPKPPTQMASSQLQVDQIVPTSAKVPLPQPSHVDEWFLPPQCSMFTCFLNKPQRSEKMPSEAAFEYDSEDSSPPSDYEDYETAIKHFQDSQLRRSPRVLDDSVPPASSSSIDSEFTDSSEDLEDAILLPGCDLKLVHLNPDLGVTGFGSTLDAAPLAATGSQEVNSDVSNDTDRSELNASVDRQWSDGCSYAWRLMRLAFVQLMAQQLTGLIKLLNLDNDFLTTYAPSLLQSKDLLDKWITGYTEDLAISCDKGDELSLGIPTIQTPEKDVYDGDFGGRLGAAPDDSFEPILSSSTRRAMAEMAHLLDPAMSPFQTRNPFSLPVKRLWFCLMSKPNLGETFIRWIYHPRHSARPSLQPIKRELPRRSLSGANISASLSPSARKVVPCDPLTKLTTNAKEADGETDGVRVNRSTSAPAQHEFSINLVHREMEPLLCMCVDKVGYQYVALATPKQLIEISVANLLSPADWLFDDFEYGLESMRNPHLKSHRRTSVGDFIFCERPSLDLAEQTHESYEVGSQGLRGLNSQIFRGLINTPAANLSERILEFSQRVVPTVLRRSVSGVQKLSAHPLVPFYLCGTASGSVHVLEWNSEEPVVSMLANTFTLTSQGLNAPLSSGVRGNPVSVLQVDTSGKRFGCGDTAGNFGLWNLDFSGSNSHPYFNCRCHGKGVLDFAFLEGSSMTFATVGVGSTPPFAAASSTVPGTAITSTAPLSGQRILTQSELEAANLIIWDALLPPSCAAVMVFAESPLDTACTCVANIPSRSNERQLAVGTKRGEVAILDLRRRPATTLFNPSAHEGSALRSISCDSVTDTLTTAGADGLVKVWRLSDPRNLLATFRSDGLGGHGSRAAAAASIAAAALFRGNQLAAVAAASRPGISEVLPLPSTSIAPVADETENFQLLSTRFLACGVDGCLQLCSVTPKPEPIWLNE